MVRGHNGERLHSPLLGQRRFAGEQGIEGRISARRIETERLGAAPAAFGIAAERAAHQFPFAIERRSHPVDRSDEGALTAARHSVAKFRPRSHSYSPETYFRKTIA